MSSVANGVGRYPVTGVVPPESGEALIRETYSSVTAFPAIASLGRTLILSYVGAPLGWAIMLPFYFLKVLPFAATRYSLTNRRLMLLKGWGQGAIPHMRTTAATPKHQVKLADIDEVRVVKDVNSDFFRAGTLEIVSQGKTVMTLPGVPEPEAFRQNIMSALTAWVPGRAPGPFVPAKVP